MLEVQNLSVTARNGTQLLKQISFQIEIGEAVGLTGQSGAGKTTLLKALLGILSGGCQVSGGTIQVDGQSLWALSPRKRRELCGTTLGFIPQNPMTALDPSMRIGRQMDETLRLHSDKSRQQRYNYILRLLHDVGLDDPDRVYRAYPHMLSGGMLQRVIIAMAMMLDAKFVLADEPTTALDVTIQAQILELINKLKKERKLSIIFITHDLGVVASIADKVAVMYAGEIIEYATVEEIFYEPCHPYTWSLLSSLPQLADDNGKLFSIPGTPPSLYTPVVGDAFALRSDYAMQIDFEEKAPQFQVSDTHWAKTWLLHEDAPKVEKPEVIQNLHEKILANMGFAHLGDEEEGNA